MREPRKLEELLSDAAHVNYLDLEDKDMICEINGLYLSGTPLHIFATRGDTEACQMLLDAGAEVDIYDGDGYTQLHSAVEQGHVETVKLLIEHGSDLTLDTPIGSTAFLAEDYPELLKLIKQTEQAVAPDGE